MEDMIKTILNMANMTKEKPSSSTYSPSRILPKRSVKEKSSDFKRLFENKYDYDDDPDSMYITTPTKGPRQVSSKTKNSQINLDTTTNEKSNSVNNNKMTTTNKKPKNSKNNHHECFECAATFPTKRSLNNHMKVHVEDRLICEICRVSFISETSLRQHVMYKHTEDGKLLYQQKLARHKIRTQEKLAANKNDSTALNDGESSSSSSSRIKSPRQINHQISSSGQYSYFCPICDKKFHNRVYVQLHFRRVHIEYVREKNQLYSNNKYKEKKRQRGINQEDDDDYFHEEKRPEVDQTVLFDPSIQIKEEPIDFGDAQSSIFILPHSPQQVKMEPEEEEENAFIDIAEYCTTELNILKDTI